jgi:hypothetical protein
MKRIWMVFGLFLLAALFAVPSHAAEAPPDTVAFLSTLAGASAGPAVCGAESAAAVPPASSLPISLGVPQPEPAALCSPPECGPNAPQQLCTGLCCRAYCCVC